LAVLSTTAAKQTILLRRFASGTLLNDPGTQIVSSGGTAAGVVISGGEQDVFGSAIGTVVAPGQQFVSRGGLDSGTTVGFGGTQSVASGGTASTTTIEFGGTAVIQSGGTLGAAILDGGTLMLSAGVLLNGGVSVPADGTLVIGGTAIPAHLLIGGFGAGDKIDLAAIAFDSGAGTAFASGTNVLEVIESGSTYFISFSSDISADSFLLTPDGGTGTDIILSSPLGIGAGQIVSISGGQISTGIDVLSGGTLEVLAGGTASGTLVHGAARKLFPPRARHGATVRDGGVQNILAGAWVRVFASAAAVCRSLKAAVRPITPSSHVGAPGWCRASLSICRSEAGPGYRRLRRRRSGATISGGTQSVYGYAVDATAYRHAEIVRPAAPPATPCSAAAAEVVGAGGTTSAPRSQAASRTSSATPSA
jgi:autotransporter passenger strand-loop-strand repeat protein